MSMSKKDYIVIAEAIKGTLEAQHQSIAMYAIEDTAKKLPTRSPVTTRPLTGRDF